MTDLDMGRIEHLVGQQPFTSKVTIIGIGSGGWPVMQFLAQSGVRRFTLVDYDTFDEANLVKHPAMRKDIGRAKVDLAQEWLLDRIPNVEIDLVEKDIWALEPGGLETLCASGDIVVSATDSNPCRHLINDACIATGTPMTVGSVHRGGVGGTVLAYRPGVSGCYACMEQVAAGLDALPSDDEIPTTNLEKDLVYGRRMAGFSSAGLAADITLVAALHAQITLGEILHNEAVSDAAIGRSPAPWAAVRLRQDGVWAWATVLLELPAIDGCASCGEPDQPSAVDIS